jgi:Ca-activated chloride channel homolog
MLSIFRVERGAFLCIAFCAVFVFTSLGTAQSSSPAPAPATPPAKTPPASSGSAAAATGTSETTVNVAAPARSKPASGEQSPPIRVQVNEVIVPVTVTDDKGRFVSDLEQKDFQVLENNKPQSIRFFTRERSQPVVIGFLLDLSSSSTVHWKSWCKTC